MRKILVLVAVLWSGAAAAAAIGVSVDLTANVHPFSPQIFGVAYGDGTRNAQMGYSVDRWGGNSTSRYNWRGPAHNTGNDYFFLGYGNDQTDNGDTFVGNALNAGIQPLMTMPTIGWVEKFDAANPTAVNWGFSQAKYGPQTLDECRFYNPQPAWCHGDAGNGLCDSTVNHTAFCVNGQIVNNDPADTSIVNAPSDDAAWIAHMQSTFHTAANGGVKLFTLDNEVMLWNSTHRDVHSVPPTYDEIWSKTVAYASAIKQQEPNALVTGPVTWGYCDLFTSADDAARGNCLDGTDRQNHGGLPFVAWYLQQVCAYQTQHGSRLVDYLDLHYYPQGTNVSLSDADDATTAGLRLRSLKELYDSTWVSESWIGQDLGDTDSNHYNKPDLIPRVRAWIDTYCAGTKLAITEYNWGNDNTVSGAVAQAEALAIFAREGVDLATRWVAPSGGTNAEKGFSIFLNYDGAGSKVQGDSVGAISTSIDQIGAYAFHGNAQTFVLLTNKDTVAHDVTLSFNAGHAATWKLYGFTGTTALAQTGNGNIAGTSLAVSALPALSANLLVVPDNDEIFKNGFE